VPRLGQKRGQRAVETGDPNILHCTRCETVKPKEQFPKKKGDKYGSWCKACKHAERVIRRIAGVVTPGSEERFWSRVEKTDGCWFWRGGITTEGYGRFFHGGTDVPVHHMPMIFRGETPPKYPMVCDHICRTRNCVRPDHIRVVHQRINSVENSGSAWAINKAKTHCDHGHDITQPGSYYSYIPGTRNCKICSAMHAKSDRIARQLGLEPRPEWFERKRAA
jgi:hypothetical protein